MIRHFKRTVKIPIFATDKNKFISGKPSIFLRVLFSTFFFLGGVCPNFSSDGGQTLVGKWGRAPDGRNWPNFRQPKETPPPPVPPQEKKNFHVTKHVGQKGLICLYRFQNTVENLQNLLWVCQIWGNFVKDDVFRSPLDKNSHLKIATLSHTNVMQSSKMSRNSQILI